MMGWIENGPLKNRGNFLSINSFLPKLKSALFGLSVLYDVRLYDACFENQPKFSLLGAS
jgi:hypothetical protein